MTPCREYSTPETAYFAGREGGPPPSRRFDVLDAPREDLLTQMATTWVHDLVTFRDADYVGAWRYVVDALELDELEAAYMLGLIHDAKPEWQQLLPGETLR